MRLPEALRAEIAREGESGYPYECCGLVLGREDPEGVRLAVSLVRTNNSREGEDRRRRFVIEPGDFLRAEAEAAALGLGVLGIYHSHPDHPPIPSAHDLAHALPFFSYLIVGVEKGEAKELTCWLLRADRTGFDPEPLEPV